MIKTQYTWRLFVDCERAIIEVFVLIWESWITYVGVVPRHAGAALGRREQATHAETMKLRIKKVNQQRLCNVVHILLPMGAHMITCSRPIYISTLPRCACSRRPATPILTLCLGVARSETGCGGTAEKDTLRM